MQKVIRRTALAEAQAARRLVRRKETHLREKGKTRREQENYTRKEVVADIHSARKARREDWELGPLAPRRDVGLEKETYGTVSTMRLRGEKLTIAERQEMNPESGRYANIVVGDRVILLQGRDKGKIGKVTEMDSLRQAVTVEGLNVVDVAVPEWMQKAEGGEKQPVRSVAQPVPLTAAKLVFALPDPETGVTRDVIVTQLINGNIFHERHTGRKRWTRYIPGINVVVPWPKVEPKEHKDYDCDTLRIDVEARSFVPSLLKPPMPSTVIDELRNKYSIFRTRHDEEYHQEKMREDEEKETKKKAAKEMLTPLKEKLKADRKALRAKGRPKLTDEMLARIGEVMARRKSILPPSQDAIVADAA